MDARQPDQSDILLSALPLLNLLPPSPSGTVPSLQVQHPLLSSSVTHFSFLLSSTIPLSSSLFFLLFLQKFLCSQAVSTKQQIRSSSVTQVTQATNNPWWRNTPWQGRVVCVTCAKMLIHIRYNFFPRSYICSDRQRWLKMWYIFLLTHLDTGIPLCVNDSHGLDVDISPIE